MSAGRGMGRGLAAILSVSGEPGEDDVHLRDIPVDLVTPNPRQPRRRFDEATLAGLAESLRQRGVLQPVLVRGVPGGTYELVAGERRWRAAQIAGLDTIPALVRSHDDAQALEVALIENMAREDLNPVDAARACAALVEELGLTREEVGRRVGRSRVAVSNLLRLLDLPDEALELLEDKARAANDHAPARRPSRPRGLHPDQAEAVGRIADALSAALGTDVRVRPSGTGYRAEVDLGSLDAALDLARRLRPRAVA